MGIEKYPSKTTIYAALRKDPVYIIGNPRSGTSLLRLMLTCHPEIVIPPEGHWFLWLEEKYGSMAFPAASSHFVDEIVGTKKFETWGIEKSMLHEVFREYMPQNYRDAVALVYCSYGIVKGRYEFSYWGDKNKLWKDKLNRVLDYFPNTKFIHIVRDGRDVACSFKDLHSRNMHKFKYGPKMPEKIKNIAEHWTVNVTFINKFIATLKQDHHITVRYEDLVMSPIQTLTNITDFLQLKFSASMLDYSQRNRDEMLEPEETMRWKLKLNDELEKSNIGKYKSLLTGQEIISFERRCGGLLKYYGYK